MNGGVKMTVLDSLKRIQRCWEISTGEKFNMHNLVGLNFDAFGDIYFCMRGDNLYRICHDSCFVEKFNVWKGYERV